MTTDTARPTTRAPIVERVAGWSARHRVIVVISWLMLIVAAFAVGQRLGTGNANSYDPGQAGRAERILDRPGIAQPDGEAVRWTFAETEPVPTYLAAFAAGPWATWPSAPQGERPITLYARASRKAWRNWSGVSTCQVREPKLSAFRARSMWTYSPTSRLAAVSRRRNSLPKLTPVRHI